jgi:hypothetical protein
MKIVELRIPHLGYSVRVKENFFERTLIDEKIALNLIDQLSIRKLLNGMPSNSELIVELISESSIFLAINTTTIKTHG